MKLDHVDERRVIAVKLRMLGLHRDWALYFACQGPIASARRDLKNIEEYSPHILQMRLDIDWSHTKYLPGDNLAAWWREELNRDTDEH